MKNTGYAFIIYIKHFLFTIIKKVWYLTLLSYRNAFETFVNRPTVITFNMNALLTALLQNDEFITIPGISTILHNKPVLKALVRASYLIELVKDDVTSTKMQVRWVTSVSHFTNNDPRFTTFKTSDAIFRKLVLDFSQFNDTTQNLISLFVSKLSVDSYEIPVDYTDRTLRPIHTESNVNWMPVQFIQDYVTTRQALLNPDFNSEYSVFKTASRKKIAVKAYKTDRALTGVSKTNREHRWEAHPDSVQFSSRMDSMLIHERLLLQILTFTGFPQSAKQGIISNIHPNSQIMISSSYSDPITGIGIEYSAFSNEIQNPIHGKSAYQVGHMNPLKTGHSGIFGHTDQNISWLTEDGNRIQGSLSLNEVNELLKTIFKNRATELGL